jgi:hypothetical protein
VWSALLNMSHDLLAFGEVLLRLQPEGGARLEEAERFVTYSGGAELNAALKHSLPGDTLPMTPERWSGS